MLDGILLLQFIITTYLIHYKCTKYLYALKIPWAIFFKIFSVSTYKVITLN